MQQCAVVAREEVVQRCPAGQLRDEQQHLAVSLHVDQFPQGRMREVLQLGDAAEKRGIPRKNLLYNLDGDAPASTRQLVLRLVDGFKPACRRMSCAGLPPRGIFRPNSRQRAARCETGHQQARSRPPARQRVGECVRADCGAPCPGRRKCLCSLTFRLSKSS